MPKKEPRQPDPPVVADWEIQDYAGETHRVDGARLTTNGDEYTFRDDTGPVFIAQKQSVVSVRRLPPRADAGG